MTEAHVVERFLGQVQGPAWASACCWRGGLAASWFERLYPRTQDGYRHVVSVAHDDQGTYGGFMRRTAIALAVVSALAIGACSSASIDEDAALACGWNEDGEPVVSALEASPDQRASTPSGRGSDLRPHGGCSRRTIGSPRLLRPRRKQRRLRHAGDAECRGDSGGTDDEWD